MKLPIKGFCAIKQCELIYLLSIFTIKSCRVSIKFPAHYFSLFLKHPYFMTLYTQGNNRNNPLIKQTNPILFSSILNIYTYQLEKSLTRFVLFPKVFFSFSLFFLVGLVITIPYMFIYLLVIKLYFSMSHYNFAVR